MIGVDGRSVDLLLQGFDRIQNAIPTLLSPDLFEALDVDQKENIIRLVTKEIGISKKELKSSREIVSKYNQISEKKRKEVNTIKTDEFYSLDPTAQMDLIYRILNSRTYRDKMYPKEMGLTDAEIFYQTSKQYMRIQSKGCDQKELKLLLSLSEQVSTEPLSCITPSQIETMALSDEKISHIIDILIDRGKFKPFPKTQEDKKALKADELLKLNALRVFLNKGEDVRSQNLCKRYLPVIVKMFNEELLPAQQEQFLNMRENELSRFTPEEKIKFLNFLLSQKLTEKDQELVANQKALILEGKGEPNTKSIIDIFNMLDSSIKADWNQMFETSRLEIRFLVEASLKEIKYEEKILNSCQLKLENITSKLTDASGVFKETLLMQKEALQKKIDDCKININIYKEKIANSKAGRSLADIRTQESREEITYFTDLKAKLGYQIQAILMKYSSKTDPNIKLSLNDEEISKNITAKDRDIVTKLVELIVSSERKIEGAKTRMPAPKATAEEVASQELSKEIAHLIEDEKISQEKLTEGLYESVMSKQIASMNLETATSLVEYSRLELQQLKSKSKPDIVQQRILEKQIEIIEKTHPHVKVKERENSEPQILKAPVLSGIQRFRLAMTKGWRNFTRIFTPSFWKRGKNRRACFMDRLFGVLQRPLLSA